MLEGLAAAPIALPEWLTRRLMSVDEYHRMGEAGILGPDDRVELIEGQIIQMAPIGSEHSGKVNCLNKLLVTSIGDRGVVSVQNSVRLSRILEPEPDFAILKPKANFYADALPTADDILLLIEVADSSLAYDSGIKTRLYARHGVPEVWIVDVQARQIVVLRNPVGEGYEVREEARVGDVVGIAALPGVSLAVGAVFE